MVDYGVTLVGPYHYPEIFLFITNYLIKPQYSYKQAYLWVFLSHGPLNANHFDLTGPV